MHARQAVQKLKSLGSPEKAKFAARFFKTGKGEYAEGDVFVGVTVPQVRSVAKEFKDLDLKSLGELLDSKLHEVRLLALCILTARYPKADEVIQQKIYDLYLKKRAHINNWDLVDTSAPHIVGRHLEKRPREILYKLSRSKVLWEKRIAILATFHFIRQNDFKDVLRLSEQYLVETHDLMHKATGWMLREVGKRNKSELLHFLDRFAPQMPRTMLRYSLEKLPKPLRLHYMHRP